ncbi:MAG: AsmA family protein [Polaromonas sp.]|nr:AsmA family protein [Polaromonas sp.]
MNNSLLQSSTFRRWLAGIAVLLVSFVVLIYFFPWDTLRGPINRHVSKQLGRRFEITQHLSVKPGFTTTVRADGIEIANPDWARDPYLLKANAVELEVRLMPLLIGKVVLPRITLTEPVAGLQIEPDGRRTWTLTQDSSDKDKKPANMPEIGTVVVDQGNVKYLAKKQGADINVLFSLAQEAGNDLPLQYKATGKWNHDAFTATGRTGGVLQFSKDTQASFPLEVNAVAGRTSLKAKGSVANLADLTRIDATFDLQGHNLDDLYNLLGVVMPSTPPYKLRGKLAKQGRIWAASEIQGTLGKSDLSGMLSFDQSAEVPLLTGKVHSKVMDFADLAPVIGLSPSASAATPKPASTDSKSSLASKPVAVKFTSPRLGKPAPRAGPAPGKVLPLTPLDVTKLKSMNADVTYSAADIRHIKELPLDKGSVHVKLNAGVMQLEPISLGVAGGSVAGSIRIDANLSPAAFATRLDVRAMQLNRLFPTIQNTKTGLGNISGQFNLNGRGDSVAQMLGSASGDVAVLMGKGEISNILLEFMGLDGGEVIKFLLAGDRTVALRCAAAAFDVKQGLMSSRAIVLDTSDTVINGQGQISLANETLDIVLKPQPKDMSIFSLRTPLRIGGTFADLSAGPEKTALAGRIGIALALAAINPLLALAATIETGPGENADCRSILAKASKPGRSSAPVANSMK